MAEAPQEGYALGAEEKRLPLAEARAIAEEVVEIMRPVCQRIEIGGSIRRGKPDCGDAEIVFIPSIDWRLSGMFGDSEPVNLQLEHVQKLIAEGLFSKRVHSNGASTCGAGAQYLWYREFKIDLFGVLAPSQFGVIFAIRTGPADFSHHKLVKPRSQGGLLLTGQRIQEGQLWDRGVALQTPDEADLFRQIECDFIAPEDRK